MTTAREWIPVLNWPRLENIPIFGADTSLWPEFNFGKEKNQNEGRKTVKGKFKIEKREVGDVVRLGGHLRQMAVTAFSEDGKQVQCEWIAEDGKAYSTPYPPAALLVQADDSEWLPYGDDEE